MLAVECTVKACLVDPGYSLCLAWTLWVASFSCISETHKHRMCECEVLNDLGGSIGLGAF